MIKFDKITAIFIVVFTYAITAFFLAVFNLSSLFNEIKFSNIAVDFNRLSEQTSQDYFFNILNGQKELTKKQAVFTPFAVIVDNSYFASRPLGLDKADLVIELPVEGAITRFLAFFNPEIKVSKIGPVRSARPYFIDLVTGIKGLLAHSGGSPQALTRLNKENNLIDIDEIGPAGIYFWRDNRFTAPHNLFTSTSLLSKAFKNTVFNWQAPDYQKISWSFLDFDNNDNNIDALIPNLEIQHPKILIDYSTDLYQVKYQYQPEKKYYLRYQGGQLDQTYIGKNLVANNVLIAMVPIKVLDSEGRLQINFISQGRAVVCKLGVCQQGFWEKLGPDQRIQFLDQDQKIIKLVPGKTWINIVPNGRKVEY